MISLVKGEQSANDRGWMELTKEMACELIDKIVVHEAIGKKPNRQRESNAAHRAKTKAERWAANTARWRHTASRLKKQRRSI